jgi:hypothetical protein
MFADSALTLGSFDRNLVLIVGESTIPTEPFHERNLTIKRITLEEAVGYYKFCRAIIVVDQPSAFTLIKQSLEQFLPDVLNHGIAFRIILHNDQDTQTALDNFKDESLGLSTFYSIADVNRLAESIARYSPGPPDSNVEIKGDVSALDPEALLVLRRSFYDCRTIHVEPITGGKDASHLLKVHAWLSNSEVKSALLPFFVKISDPEKISKELDNYRVYTDLYISFQYRPNCRIERCVITKNYGSLVGNFVEDSIPLRDSLFMSYDTGIIFSLFEKSLKGFRRLPHLSSTTSQTGNLKQFVEDRICISELLKRDDLINKAQSLGLKSAAQELHDRLILKCTSPCLTSPIHGDLHSGNIMVRGNDAIVIDFSAIKPQGPLTADPATLEISLTFNLGEKDTPSFSEWRAFIDEIYAPDKLAKPLAITDEIPNKFSWLKRSVREIRHVLAGCHCCSNEVEAILACYLMRMARLAPEKVVNDKDELQFSLHAYALVVAERIIDFIETH